MKKFFMVVLLTGLVTGPASAAVISGALNTSPVEADITSAGVIGAINVGASDGTGAFKAAAVTVNGVDFAAAGVSEAGNALFGNTIGNASVGALNVVSTTNVDAFSTFNASGFTGAAGTLFDSVMLALGTGNEFTFSMSDLQIGDSYTLQVYLASGSQSDREGEFLQGATSVLTWDNGGHGDSIATFTFTADAATETLTYRDDPLGGGTASQSQPIMSGYLFASTAAAIPEPASLALGLLGAMGLSYSARRRRS